MIWGWGGREPRKKFKDHYVGKNKFKKGLLQVKINFKRPSPGKNNFQSHSCGKYEFIFNFSSGHPQIING